MSRIGASTAARSRRRGRRIVVVLAVLVLVGAGAGWLVAAAAGGEQTQPVAVPRHTAKISRQTLLETEQVDATLGYGDVTPLVNRLSGTLTQSIEIGAVTGRGTVLYSVDMRPVVVLIGEVPAYRTLAEGVTGSDVAQFEENLAALGYGGFVVDSTYTYATTGAVRQWQGDLGTEQSGAVELGTVYFLPDPVRIASVTTRKGAPVGRGESVIGYTNIARTVRATLDADQVALTPIDATVGVSVGSGSDIEGRVVRVSIDENNPPQDNQRAQPDANERFTVVIRVEGPATAHLRDGASVSVTLTGERREHVLAVPVIALLALREGGYGIELVEGATTRIVGVTTGLFARGMVEVTNDHLREGMIVGTAAP